MHALEHFTKHPMYHHPMGLVSRGESDLIRKSLHDLDNGKVKDPIDKLRLVCLSRGVYSIFFLGRALRRIDDHGYNQLSFDEFRSGLAEIGMDCKDREVIEMFNAFENQNGSIDVTEFLMALRSNMNDTRKQVVSECFRKMDITGSGFITVDDLKNEYSVQHHPLFVSGEETEETIMKKFLSTFEENAIINGRVTREEFFNYYSGLSASIEEDEFFDFLMRRSYNL